MLGFSAAEEGEAKARGAQRERASRVGGPLSCGAGPSPARIYQGARRPHHKKEAGYFFLSASSSAAISLWRSSRCATVNGSFAFFFAAGTLTLRHITVEGRSWQPCILAPLVAVPAFLLLVGGGYVRMLALFSRGIMNFVVDPEPHVLILLIALVWLVPYLLALFFQQRRPEAATFGALFIFSLGLLPVALARVDSQHVYFNELSIFLLSFIAICYVAPRKQILWAVIVAVVVLGGHAVNIVRFGFGLKAVVHDKLFGPNAGLPGEATQAVLRRFAPHVLDRQLYYTKASNEHFDTDRLLQLTHGQMVGLPIETSIEIEFGTQFTGGVHRMVDCLIDRKVAVQNDV